MKKNFYQCIILTLLIIILAGRAYSDFGNFSGNNDYGGGGSGGSSYSSGSSRGSGYSGGDLSSGYGGGSVSYSNNFGVLPMFATGSFMDSPESGILIYIAAFLIIGCLIAAGKRRTRQRHEAYNNESVTGTVQTAQYKTTGNLTPMSEYKNLDPEFDDGKLKSHIANLYVQMQDAWTSKNLDSLRPYLTDAFYNQMDRQLEAFRRTNRTDYTDRIAVLDVILKGYRLSGDMDYITAGLKARIVSYVLDDRTGKVVSGDMNHEKFMEYELELTRKTGTITHKTDGPQTTTCPHCGAPLVLNASAKCSYCDSVITVSNTEWAVCGMKGISQRTL